ncbi:TPA: cadmium-translocating P-type ATPase [Candidatus Bipolaricaulota bacterium]|nr:cadmium-translocating P-type ATPase [Candidatus Bipolaricaulota bacterium]
MNGEDMNLQEQTLKIGQLHCPTCARQVAGRVAAVAGVARAEVDQLTGSLVVAYDPRRIAPEDLSRAVAAISGHISHPEEEGKGKLEGILTLVSGTLLVAGGLATLSGGLTLGPVAGALIPLSSVLFGLGALLGGIPVARRALAELRRRLLGIDLLVSIAITGALALGETFEAGSLAFLFGVAEWLEDRAAGRARRSLRELLDRVPKRATVLRGGGELELPVEAISPGEVILVRPGETIGLDGVVVRGRASVSEAAITGEATPVLKEEGSPVYAGTLNEDGALEIRVTRPVGDSTLARIAKLVEEARRRKAPTERLVDRFARYYTPAVVGVALLVATLPPLLGLPPRVWLLRALTLLVIACPCALAISTPAAMVSALVASARRGILVKGGAALEAVAKVKHLALDKTGTLTTGELQAQVVTLDEKPPEEVLLIAAALERGSEHPIARAIGRLAEGTPLPQLDSFQPLPGRGVRGVIQGQEYLVGRPELFPPLPNQVEELLTEGNSLVIVGKPNHPFGVILLSDRLRPEAREALSRLTALGVKPVLLTGDRAPPARAVAAALGIEEVHAELLPEEKVEWVKRLKSRGGVAMVGDGVNDAPALAAADVGIAMGAIGTDVAIEAGDVALMKDDLAGVPELISLGRRSLSVIRTNVAVALFLKLLVAALAFAGYASLALAVLIGDVGATLLVTANAMRLQRPSRNARRNT